MSLFRINIIFVLLIIFSISGLSLTVRIINQTNGPITVNLLNNGTKNVYQHPHVGGGSTLDYNTGPWRISQLFTVTYSNGTILSNLIPGGNASTGVGLDFTITIGNKIDVATGLIAPSQPATR